MKLAAASCASPLPTAASSKPLPSPKINRLSARTPRPTGCRNPVRLAPGWALVSPTQAAESLRPRQAPGPPPSTRTAALGSRRREQRPAGPRPAAAAERGPSRGATERLTGLSGARSIWAGNRTTAHSYNPSTSSERSNDRRERIGSSASTWRAEHTRLRASAKVRPHRAIDDTASLTGCGKSRDFGKTVMKRARNGNPGLIKSTGYEGAKGDELGWKHHRPTFSAAC
jgi:hypothetical protein